MNRFYRNLLVAAGLTFTIAACQEQLTAPGSCPATCPGGTPVVHDTVLDAIPDSDFTYQGYFNRGAGRSPGGLLVSNGLNGSTDFAVIEFGSRPDTVFARDTIGADDSVFHYTIDSVAIELSLMTRDTLASGAVIELRRLPITLDTSVSHAELAPLMASGVLLDTVTIADSLRPDAMPSGKRYRFVFQGGTLGLVDIPAADSGILSIGVAITGPTTGIRIGGITSQNLSPTFLTYVSVPITDTTTANRHQLIPRGPAFTSFTQSVPPASDPDLLYAGTYSSKRAFLRFPWPPYLRDSALLARATLELTPAAPFTGLPNSANTLLFAYGVRVDFGPKSVQSTTTTPGRTLVLGSQDTMRLDVINEVVLWQSVSTSLPHPPILFVAMTNEGASFIEPSFFSTRSPAGAPRLRVTYQLPFDFERP